MPMYSFRCPVCGKRFEELLTMDKLNQAHCPDCGEKAEREWMGKCNSPRPTVKTASAPECGCAGMCPNAGACAKR